MSIQIFCDFCHKQVSGAYKLMRETPSLGSTLDLCEACNSKITVFLLKLRAAQKNRPADK